MFQIYVNMHLIRDQHLILTVVCNDPQCHSQTVNSVDMHASDNESVKQLVRRGVNIHWISHCKSSSASSGHASQQAQEESRCRCEGAGKHMQSLVISSPRHVHDTGMPRHLDLPFMLLRLNRFARLHHDAGYPTATESECLSANHVLQLTPLATLQH